MLGLKDNSPEIYQNIFEIMQKLFCFEDADKQTKETIF